MRENKSNIKRIAVLLLAVMLLIGCTIGGTLAWLSATTTEVTNTFTIGNITIDLKEHKLGTDGTLTNEEVVENSYKIVPGGKQPKDPFVTVEAGSEKCYVYVLVTNTVMVDETIVATPNIESEKWSVVKADGGKTLYRYYQVVDASAADVECPVFTSVEYSDSIEKDDIETLTNTKIIIDAYAHQSENITDVTVADNAAKDHFELT